MDISWKNHIYNIFDSKKVTAKYAMLNKRRRNLILSVPPDQHFNTEDLIKINIDIAMEYKDLSARTINRDISELTTLGLLAVDSKGLYYANYDLLKQYMPRKISRK